MRTVAPHMYRSAVAGSQPYACTRHCCVSLQIRESMQDREMKEVPGSLALLSLIHKSLGPPLPSSVLAPSVRPSSSSKPATSLRYSFSRLSPRRFRFLATPVYSVKDYAIGFLSVLSIVLFFWRCLVFTATFLATPWIKAPAMPSSSPWSVEDNVPSHQR